MMLCSDVVRYLQLQGEDGGSIVLQNAGVTTQKAMTSIFTVMKISVFATFSCITLHILFVNTHFLCGVVFQILQSSIRNYIKRDHQHQKYKEKLFSNIKGTFRL